MVVGFPQTMFITTKGCEFESRTGELYSKQHSVIKLVSVTSRRLVAFFEHTTNKTDRNNITEILLKLTLSTITLTPKDK
jgi:hypothetical protein